MPAFARKRIAKKNAPMMGRFFMGAAACGEVYSSSISGTRWARAHSNS